jgi:hypothetical protein
MVQLETPGRTRPFAAWETGHGLVAGEPSTEIRWDKVAAIREAIMDGTYETPEKIDATFRTLFERLRWES